MACPIGNPFTTAAEWMLNKAFHSNHQRPLRVNRNQRVRQQRRAMVAIFVDYWLRHMEAREILGHEPYHVLQFHFADSHEPLNHQIGFAELHQLAMDAIHRRGMTLIGEAP